MPRMKEDARTLLSDLTGRLERLVAAARKEGRESALSELRALVGGGGGPARRGPGRPPKAAKAAPARRKKRRKNPWASMTAEQRADRVRKMLAGRGLKPKGER